MVGSGLGPGPMGPRVWFLPYASFYHIILSITSIQKSQTYIFPFLSNSASGSARVLNDGSFESFFHFLFDGSITKAHKMLSIFLSTYLR